MSKNYFYLPERDFLKKFTSSQNKLFNDFYTAHVYLFLEIVAFCHLSSVLLFFFSYNPTILEYLQRKKS